MRTSLLLMGLFLMAGCGVNAPLHGRMDPWVPPQVAFADRDLRSNTACDLPRSHRDRAGQLYVTVPIRSTCNLNLHVDYRYRFFDRTGVLLEETGWMGGKTLESNVPDAISFNSMSPLAEQFQLDIRYAR